ncbi:MAG: DUF2007 domain-containing protein [Ruminococcaceae bacterium]|nr:DUF2007 domain-containing protein [Oscillospiraceae bacterium]
MAFDHLFGLDKPVQKDDVAHLTAAHNDIELSVLCSILEGEGIPYITHDRGVGSVMRILSGDNRYGSDIYVLPEDLERATEVLDAYRNAEPVEEDEDGDWDEDEDEDEEL